MSDPFSFADELGPKKIIHVHNPSVGLRGILVIDNVAIGPAIGGLRMAPDVSLEECFRLARAMTLKNAAAGLSHGGGKSVLFGDPSMPADKKEQLIRCMASTLREESDYIFGPDMGTNEICMGWVKDEIGRSVGLPAALGGIPLDEIGATGLGVMHACDVAAASIGISLSGARIAIQGFGAVGKHAARFLAEKGAVISAVSDSKGAIVNPAGIDVAALIALKAAGKSVTELPGAKAAADVVSADCDILIPAARPDVIHEQNVESVRAKLVVSGANIPMTPGAEKRLHEKGILYIPDFIANAGGVICAAMEYHGSTKTSAFESIEEKIRANTEEVIRQSSKAGILPRQAAVNLALSRLRHAMSMRRFALF
jgi:glutamate dehydrogenase (NAD(P)+)